jgi:PEP-CTERM motif
MRIPKLFLAPVFVLGFVSLASPSFASTIVVPNGATSTPGNTTDGADMTDPLTIHVQLLIAAGQFASAGNLLLIDQMAWRSAPDKGPFSMSVGSFDISASTSTRVTNPANPAFLSLTFADNIGPDNTPVFHGGGTFSSPGCSGPAPCPFDVLFNFQTPFLYDRLAGNLLLDMVIRDLHTIIKDGALDAVSFDTFGPMAAAIGLVGSPTALGTDTGGDVTRFRVTAVPEPATMTLLVSGLGAIAATRKRRKP